MRRLLSLALICALICLPVTGAAMDTATQDGYDVNDYVNWDLPQELVVASTTQMSGHFFTDMWGNNTADMDVRALIHGYGTVAFSQNGNFTVDDTVVAQAGFVDNEDGSRTYTFRINEGLTYNDGTPITAADYVFSALLISSPQLTDFGGVPAALDHIEGYEEYRAGGAFSGVRLLGEYEFSLTILSEALPYYYELSLVNIIPYPIHVIAPGCSVADRGEGALIEGEFTSELIEKTVLDPDNGYLFFPAVTAGPYTLRNYNQVERTATFEKNPYYVGNYEGQAPIIEKITFIHAGEGDSMIDRLAGGEIDIINKISDGDAIAQAVSLQSQDMLKTLNYWRSGMSYLSFSCELAPTDSENVRKAISYCLNVPEIIAQFNSGYGLPVYGYYGMGQWMAVQSGSALNELALYEFDINAAIGLLEADGWTLGSDGGAYDPAAGEPRHRLNDEGELDALTIKWAKSQGSGFSEALDTALTDSFAQAGIGLEVDEIEFTDLLAHYYRQEDRTYNMFNLATNFDIVYDPYYAYHTGDEFQGVFNTTGLRDEELMRLAYDLRSTDTGDDESYLEKWMEFQRYWVEVMPMKPIYSNIYFDAVRPDVQGYDANARHSWAAAVLYAYIGEPMPNDDVMGLDGQPDSDGLEELE